MSTEQRKGSREGEVRPGGAARQGRRGSACCGGAGGARGVLRSDHVESVRRRPGRRSAGARAARRRSAAAIRPRSPS